MEFRILGPLEVRDAERQIPLGGGKQKALLALLLLNANEPVSTERLVDELWGENPPATAQKVVQNHVSQLRRLLEQDGSDTAVLATQGSGYALHVLPGELDLQRFEESLERGRRALAEGDPRSASELLHEALGLWRGPALADLAYQPFAQTEIARLEERRLVATEERIEADIALGRQADLVGELDALVKAQPLRERLWAQLMLCLYRSGRQAEALEAYAEARRSLVEELGIEPGRPLRELHQQILRQEPGLDLATDPQLPGEPARSAFVGRESELAELVAGLDDAFAGRGGLFLLVGEPGIGKSRLADELMVRARERGAQILVGRCWEAGGAPAYWPWVQSLRAFVRESDPAELRTQLGAGAADVAQIVPELRQLIADLPEPPALESESARFRLFDATAEFLRNASESRPILLVLDDLHAADTPSLLLLQFIARQLGSTRLLVLCALRDVDPIPAEALTAMLGELAREPVTRRLSVGGLSERAVAEYVELTSTEIASPELIAALHGETEGNPLFIGETVRLLAVEGIGADPSGGMPIAIPQTVRDVIARRLGHLSEECNRLLVLASVLGREFALGGLARLGDVSEDELLDSLDEAMVARVVSDVPGAAGRLRFAHVLIRDTLYEGLTTARRVRLHRHAVEALEALYGDESGPYLAELAHHSIAGSDFDKGLRYARRAGDRALALLAYEEAARLYGTGIDALDLSRPSERTRCELLLSVGEAELRAGNSPAAQKAFLEAAEIARRRRLPGELARAAAGYGGRFMWGRAGDDVRLVPLLEEGLAALDEAEDVELRASLLARLAGALRDEHSRDRRARLSREAVEVARGTGNPTALAYALDGLHAAIIAPDTVAECLELGREFRELAERSGDLERIANALDRERAAQVIAGELRESEIDLEELADSGIVEELGQPAQLWQMYTARAMFALAAGNLAAAEELIPLAWRFGERALAETAIPVYRLQRYALRDLQGRLEEVMPEIRDLAADYPARPVFRCALAHLHARLGRRSEAEQALHELAEDGFSALPFDQEWLYGMSLLAETSALLADSDSATVLYELLVPWAALTAADYPEGIRGSVSRYLGQLATTTARFPEAARHFEEGVEVNDRMGLRPWLAHTQHDYAQMLLARRSPGDEEEAQRLLASALATYRELGIGSYEALVAKELLAS